MSLPPAQGIFSDVPTSSPAAAWIEELYARGITLGCLQVPKSYCPAEPLIDSHLVVLLERAFGKP